MRAIGNGGGRIGNSHCARLVAVLRSACTALLLASCSAPPAGPYAPPTPVLSHPAKVFPFSIDRPASAARLADERPNIIVFLTDDQPFHTVDYMPAVKNELMARGVAFENGFATTPLCCPSRVSLLTGEYVHNHGVFTDRWPMGGALKFDARTSLAVALNQAGYRTGYFGKYLNGYEDMEPRGAVPPGWTDWGVFLANQTNPDDDRGNAQFYFDFTMSLNGTETNYPRSKSGFSADVITSFALSFIRDVRDAPFFLMLGYYNPHSPYLSAPRHKDAFRAATDWDWIPYRPPDFNEEDVGDKPRYMASIPRLSPEEINTTHLQILRSLLSVDDGVASVLAALKQAGLDRRTVIFFLSDNGLTLGDHGFGASKNCPYEACLKIPFIVYGPEYFAPRVDSHLVANIDVFPTVAELARASTPEAVDGMSLVPLLKDPAASWRDCLLLEHWPTEEGIGSMIPRFSSVRTPEWKYTEYDTGEAELYDLVRDPYELQNLNNRIDLWQIRAGLAQKLRQLEAQ